MRTPRFPTPRFPSRTVLALTVTLCAACAHPQPGPLPPRKAATPHPATRELGRPAAEVQRLIESAPFELHDVKRAERGVMGVSKATAHFPEQRVDLPVKWAPAPPVSLDAWNAAPRKEIAAFAVQQWFLEPDDWIVPPTTIRCVPLSEYPVEPKPAPTVQGTRCVLGLVAAWLKDVKPAEVIYDPDHFAKDRTYAASVADFNLLTYLIEHRDGRGGNILVSDDGERVWSVDNGIAFGNLVWNYFVTNWDVLRVPALRKASVDRLRRVSKADLDALLVVRELRADRQGVLQPVKPSAAFDPSVGARVRGTQVQLGLSRPEVDAVADRLRALLAHVDAGEIKTF
jgi:hypothetical protein